MDGRIGKEKPIAIVAAIRPQLAGESRFDNIRDPYSPFQNYTGAMLQ